MASNDGPPKQLGPAEIHTQEYVETRSVTLEWKVSNLKTIFESSQGLTKSKCIKSALFDSHRWQIFFYPNSGNENYCSLYLSCEPTAAEREKGAAEKRAWNAAQAGSTAIEDGKDSSGNKQPANSSGKSSKGPWKREGKYRFTFEAKTVDRRVVFKQMGSEGHSFSDNGERNWGYANFWKRSDAYYNNPSLRSADAFLIVCTIVSSPTPPTAPPLPRLLIPKDLVNAYASLFDDPDYSDVCFRIMPEGKSGPERRIYAAKKVLAGRCEYFETMFSSGFNESSHGVLGNFTSPVSISTGSPTQPGQQSVFPELNDDEDETDLEPESDSGSGREGEEEEDQEDENWDEDDDSDMEEEEEELEERDGQREKTPLGPDEGGNTGGKNQMRVSSAVTLLSESQEVSGQKLHSSRPSSATAVSDCDERTDSPEETRMEKAEQAENEEAEGICSESREMKQSSIGHKRDDSTATLGHFVDAQQSAPVSPRSKRSSAPARANLGITTSTISKSDAVVDKKKRPRRKSKLTQDGRPRFEVIVTDAAYTSFKALLYYLYTDSVSFAPLASTYHVAREAAQQRNALFPFPSRRQYLLATSPFTSSVYPASGSRKAPGPCSAKALYRLADKIGLPELKERACEHILASLTVEIIPYEVFGSFSMRFEEIKRVEIAFLLDKWNEVRGSPSMRKVFNCIRFGRFPGFEDVWVRILESLEYRPPALMTEEESTEK